MRWGRRGGVDAIAVEGRGGRLFLDGDSNRVVDQFTGRRRLKPRQLAQWRRLLERRAEYCAERGIHYVFAIPPTAHAVYPEDLPPEVPAGAERPVEQLLQHLEGSAATTPLYLLEAMQRAKADGIVYSLTDTHWSEFGAYRGYRAIVEQLPPGVPIRPVEPDQVEFVEEDHVGDLGGKLDPPRISRTLVAKMPESGASWTYDNRVRNRGRLWIGTRPKTPGRCLAFGDSYAYRMMGVLRESFGSFAFAHLEALDRRLADELRPDLIIQILNERFLIRVPDDRKGLGVRSLAAEKEAAGDLL